MSDGLREVLDICDRYERQGMGSASDFDKGAQRAAYDIGLKLRSLLAAHPVEPAAPDWGPDWDEEKYEAAVVKGMPRLPGDFTASPVRGIAEGGGTIVDAHAYVVGMEQAGCANPRHADMACPALASPTAEGGGITDEAVEVVAGFFARSIGRSYGRPVKDDQVRARAALEAALPLFSKPAAEPQCICHMIVDTYPDPDCPQYSEHIPPAEEGS